MEYYDEEKQNDEYVKRTIEIAKTNFISENPTVAFGEQLIENSPVFPFQYPVVKGETYLLIDATERDCLPVVEEAVFLSFETCEIYDEATCEYQGYEVYYNFQTESEPEKFFSDTSISGTERMGYFMIYEKKSA